jgi:hypothetical protein
LLADVFNGCKRYTDARSIVDIGLVERASDHLENQSMDSGLARAIF